MAYFPNGSAGMDYEAHYCDKCVHWQDDNPCAVMGLHMSWNYEACNGDQPDATPEAKAKFYALEYLIPHIPNSLGADQCKMFHPVAGVEMVEDVTEKLKSWEAIYGKRTE